MGLEAEWMWGGWDCEGELGVGSGGCGIAWWWDCEVSWGLGLEAEWMHGGWGVVTGLLRELGLGLEAEWMRGGWSVVTRL